ncbi:MAG: hypothetical protein P8N09_09550 [Planctomycetota bacterium]|nr:hypothetical protein [Planctomycetota bacterium]
MPRRRDDTVGQFLSAWRPDLSRGVDDVTCVSSAKKTGALPFGNAPVEMRHRGTL